MLAVTCPLLPTPTHWWILKVIHQNALSWFPVLKAESTIRFHSTFNNNTKIELLISLLKDETKRSVESTGCNGMFYATVLKPPETDFGNSVFVLHLKINTLLDQPYLKANDKTRLQHYNQHLADTKIQLYCMKTCWRL